MAQTISTYDNTKGWINFKLVNSDTFCTLAFWATNVVNLESREQLDFYEVIV